MASGLSRRRSESDADDNADRASQRPRTQIGATPGTAPEAAASTESVDGAAIGHGAASSDPEPAAAGQADAVVDDGRTTPVQDHAGFLEKVRMSGSPTRVYGNRVSTSFHFANYRGGAPCLVDKSLVCKGFWDVEDIAIRICLPRRSGKTYNLTQLLLFFSMSPELNRLASVPNSVLSSSGLDESAVSKMSVADLCRKKREFLFKDSLLQTLHPEFFEQHFMKYPVIHITLSGCRGTTYVDFLKTLWESFANAARQWLKDNMVTEASVSETARDSLARLKKTLEHYDNVSLLDGSSVTNRASLAQTLFTVLSELVYDQFGQYILLVDEYDMPFIDIRLANWSEADKQAARATLESLFQRMDNLYMCKSLLIGVFEVQMAGMGSGANSIVDIRLIPALEKDIRHSITRASVPHSRDGMDALTDAFWFNEAEVELLVVSSIGQYLHTADDKAVVLQTIREWYDGYCIGRFCGKYIPWSVISYVQDLRSILNDCTPSRSAQGMLVDGATLAADANLAATNYWVSTGTTRLIDAYIKQYPVPIIRLMTRLIYEFEAHIRRPAELQDLADMDDASDLRVLLVSTALDVTEHFGREFAEAKFLSLCLYGGYLTRRAINTVCIPNREVFTVWRELFGHATVGENTTSQLRTVRRGILLEELWAGKTDLLHELIRSSHSALAGHNHFKERDYADHASSLLLAAAAFGALTHPDSYGVSMADVTLTREAPAGSGRCDCLLRLYSTRGKANEFGVIIEFKLIPMSMRDDIKRNLGGDASDEDINIAFNRRCTELATSGLNQITDKDYATVLNAGCLERMHIGMAIGNNAVCTATKLFRRQDARNAEWTVVDKLK